MQVRLNKYLAQAGLSSRRKADELIDLGRVKVNNKIITKLGSTVDPDFDLVEVDNKKVGDKQIKIVLMLNKPVGYTCTNRRFKGEKNIFDLVKTKQRLYSIGRLDKNSSGLILLTNDGDLALKLTHPRYEKEKEYIVEVDKNLTEGFLTKLNKGVNLKDGKTLPAKTKKITKNSFSITLKQGKKRQIRRMCQTLGFEVIKLYRTRLNKLQLGKLQSGECRELTKSELEDLQK